MSQQFSQKEKREIGRYRKMFPETIRVMVERGERGYVAEILSWPGAFTQADSFAELIFMVNDCVRTVLEIPEKYAPEMPNYYPPLVLAQKFNEFPSTIKKESVEFYLSPERVYNT